MINKIKITIICFFSVLQSFGQSFNVPHDTIYSYVRGSDNIHNDITSLSEDTIQIQWRVISHNFTTEWGENIGICDNNSCYTNTNNVLLDGNTFTTAKIKPFGFCNFYLLLGFFGVSSGTHFLTVEFKQDTTTTNATWVVRKIATNLNSQDLASSGISLYPNPAKNVLYISSNSSSSKFVEIYNLSGQRIVKKNLIEQPSELSIGDLSPGLYFANFSDLEGNLLFSEKFVIN